MPREQNGGVSLRLPFRAALTGTALAAAFLLALGGSAETQNIVSDLRLADGDSERVVFTSPANPTAILVMFAGGEGTVEIAGSGMIGKYRQFPAPDAAALVGTGFRGRDPRCAQQRLAQRTAAN